jgi:hypothetical protein
LSLEQHNRIHELTGRDVDKENTLNAWCQRTFGHPLKDLTTVEAGMTIKMSEKAAAEKAQK